MVWMVGGKSNSVRKRIQDGKTGISPNQENFPPLLSEGGDEFVAASGEIGGGTGFGFGEGGEEEQAEQKSAVLGRARLPRVERLAGASAPNRSRRTAG